MFVHSELSDWQVMQQMKKKKNDLSWESLGGANAYSMDSLLVSALDPRCITSAVLVAPAPALSLLLLQCQGQLNGQIHAHGRVTAPPRHSERFLRFERICPKILPGSWSLCRQHSSTPV